MSGQGNLINFEVVGETDDSEGAVIISRRPIDSGTPTDGQMLVYSAVVNRWQYKTPAINQFWSALGPDNITPVVDEYIPVPTDTAFQGTSISRFSDTTFTVQPGLYRLTLTLNKATFGASGSNQSVVYALYDLTSGVFIGLSTEVTGFAPARTVVAGVLIDRVRRFQIPSNIGVRIISVSGTTPLLFGPSLNIYKID